MRCEQVKDQFSAWLDGELADDDVVAVRAHLDECPSCRAELEKLQRTIAAVKELPPMSAPAALRQKVLAAVQRERATPKISLWRVVWPAAAAVVIGLAFWAFYDRGARPVRRDVAFKSGPAEEADKSASGRLDVESVARQREEAQTLQPAQVAAKSAAPAEPAPFVGKGGAPARAKAAPPAQPPVAGALAKASPQPDSAMPQTVSNVAQPSFAAAPLPVEEITIVADNPKAACERAMSAARERGWRIVEKPEAGDPSPKLLLSVALPDVPKVRDTLAFAVRPKDGDRMVAEKRSAPAKGEIAPVAEQKALDSAPQLRRDTAQTEAATQQGMPQQLSQQSFVRVLVTFRPAVQGK